MHVGSVIGGIAGLALLVLAFVVVRTMALASLSNLVLKGWRSGRRVDPLSRYDRFRCIGLSLILCFFGVLMLLAAFGVG